MLTSVWNCRRICLKYVVKEVRSVSNLTLWHSCNCQSVVYIRRMASYNSKCCRIWTKFFSYGRQLCASSHLATSRLKTGVVYRRSALKWEMKWWVPILFGPIWWVCCGENSHKSSSKNWTAGFSKNQSFIRIIMYILLIFCARTIILWTWRERQEKLILNWVPY